MLTVTALSAAGLFIPTLNRVRAWRSPHNTNMIINIIGMGIGRNLAPKDGIRWGITRTILDDMDVNVLFEIHDHDNAPGATIALQDKMAQKCEETQTPFFTVRKYSDMAMEYPLYKIIKEFKTTMFASSICYAIAMAIYQGAKEINLYGVNMSKKYFKEYGHQKPGVDHWVGIARGRGVTVNIHGRRSEIGKTSTGFIYGYNLPQSELEEYVRSL